jgi:hypothetical protein
MKTVEIEQSNPDESRGGKRAAKFDVRARISQRRIIGSPPFLRTRSPSARNSADDKRYWRFRVYCTQYRVRI